MAQDNGFTDLPDEAMIPYYRSKAPYQRLEIAFALWSFARSLVKGGLKTQHPDWPGRKIEEETSRRMLHAAD